MGAVLEKAPYEKVIPLFQRNVKTVLRMVI
jgi:hypothetical protein